VINASVSKAVSDKKEKGTTFVPRGNEPLPKKKAEAAVGEKPHPKFRRPGETIEPDELDQLTPSYGNAN
jgi:hypothetical protein